MQENTGVRLSSTVPNKVVLSLVLVYWYTSLEFLLKSGCYHQARLSAWPVRPVRPWPARPDLSAITKLYVDLLSGSRLQYLHGWVVQNRAYLQKAYKIKFIYSFLIDTVQIELWQKITKFKQKFLNEREWNDKKIQKVSLKTKWSSRIHN